jgi:hypothetical protein
MITRDAKCTREIKTRFAMSINKKKFLLTSHFDFNLRKTPIKYFIWSIAVCCAETWTLRAVDRKCLESFEMWCWRRMEKISWTDRARNEVLHRVREERNIRQTIKRRKAEWIGQFLRGNCLLKHFIEGKIEGRIEVTGRRGRSKQLLNDVKEERRYSKLREEAVDRILWSTRFGRSC